MEGLTPKQKIFCEEYTKDWNATRAMIVAGYSPKTASEQGSRMLTDVKVKNYIEKIKEENSRQANVERYEIIMGLKKIINDPYAKNRDKIAAFKLLGDYLDMWNCKPEITVNNQLEIKLPEFGDDNDN
jgi:phage terminase small subunit